MISTINFSIRGFNAIWDHIYVFVSTDWCLERDSRSSCKSVDVILMNLEKFKNCCAWEYLGKCLKSKD